MHDRRQSYRFHATPGGDPIVVSGREASAAARLVDTSASGLSVELTGDWTPAIGEKVEVELAHDERVVAQVVRVVREETPPVIGLRRLQEAWDDRETGQSVQVASVKVKSAGVPAWLTVLVLVIGLLLGAAAWHWRSLVFSGGLTGQPPESPHVLDKPAHSIAPQSGFRKPAHAANRRSQRHLLASAASLLTY